MLCVLALAIAAAGCRRREPRARPAPTPPGSTPGVLHLQITDGPGGPPVAARVYLWGGPAADRPVHIGVNDRYDGTRQVAGYCMLGTGALGTWDGLVLPWGAADVPIGGGDGCDPSPAIPLGTYRVWAWRGIEFERWQGTVTVGAGDDVTLTIPLERAWRADGTVAADMHVHAAASNDSGLPDTIRVMSEAAAGIQVVGLSNHDVDSDARGAIRALGLVGTIASIPSNEFGNDWVHLGIYPVVVDRKAPRGGSPSFDELEDLDPGHMMAQARAFTGRPIVQVNHPRFRAYALFDTTEWNGVSWPPPFPLDFDAVEVLNGHTVFDEPDDLRLDDSVRDFMTFLQHGYLVAAVGNSDTHHLDGVRDGVARTYVYVDHPGLAPLDVLGFVRAVRARRAVATTCPWLEVRAGVAGPGQVQAGPGEAVRARGGLVGLDVGARPGPVVPRRPDSGSGSAGSRSGSSRCRRASDRPGLTSCCRWARTTPSSRSTRSVRARCPR